MDARKWLDTGRVLSFPGMRCRIKSYMGRGSNALVYLGEYEDQFSSGQYHDVIIKELFPLHPNGAIYRDETDCIRVEPEGEDLYRIHKESFDRGNRIHLELLKDNPAMVGGNVNTHELNGTLYTLLSCSGSVGFEAAMQMEGITLRKIAERMICLLEALSVFHRAGMLHLDISPDNVLIIPQGQREHILLIDYNSAGVHEQWRNGSVEYASIKHGYTAPEVCNGQYEKVGPQSDLYSVAAVFYSCLMGRRLSTEETIRAVPPDAAESPYLAELSDVVKYMVRRILRRGLHTVASRRYSDIAAMKTDFQELLARIDCIGVTHWALFDASQKVLDSLIRNNPTFAFLSRKDELYPLHFRAEPSGEALNVNEFLARSAASGAVLLRAGGGQGKTTALLYSALRQNARYSPKETTAVYLSAYAYRPEEKWFIHDSILRMLKFNKETKSYEAARHELDQMLSKPLADGTKPVLMLLVDGLNEICHDASLLVQELNELSSLPGVSVIVSSRSDVQGLNAGVCSMNLLSDEEVADVLSAQGLLVPEDHEVQRILRTPLILSLFVRTSRASDRQISISTADELIRSMLQMETNRYPEDADEHWQMDAAIHYVLPAIAQQETVRSGMLTEQDLLKIVSRCYNSVKTRALLGYYPRWIGRLGAILGGAKDAEEWYSIIVHELLWRRTGLLIRDENGAYRVFHQQIGEWLIILHQDNQKWLLKRRCRMAGLVAVGVLAFAGLMWRGIWTPYVRPLIEQRTVSYYPKEEAEEIVESALSQCYTAKNASVLAEAVLPYAKANEELYFDSYCDMNLIEIQAAAGVPGYSFAVMYEEFNEPKGNWLMPWSEEDFKYELYCELADLPSEMAQEYSDALNVLSWLMSNEKWYSRYAEDYIGKFEALIRIDKALVDAYYCELVEPELEGMLRSDSSMHWDLSVIYPYSKEGDERTEGIQILKETRGRILTEIRNNSTVERYKQEQK